MQHIEIISIDSLSSNESGYTLELITKATSGHLIGFRKRGTIFGNHYHLGKSQAKNPEVLVLITGSVKLTWSAVNGSSEGEELLEAPIRIHIYPHTLHTLEALTDVHFIEFNSLEEHKSDTEYP